MINSPQQAISAAADAAGELGAGITDEAAANPDPANDAAIRAIIAELRRSSALPYRDALAARLEFLRIAFNEDGDGDIFKVDSLQAMLAFLESAPPTPYPTITLTPGGDACVTWQRGSNYFFGADFMSSNRVRFAADYPNANNASLTDKLSGMTTPLELAELVSHVRVADWAQQ